MVFLTCNAYYSAQHFQKMTVTENGEAVRKSQNKRAFKAKFYDY
jgi:hypothetical protein